MDGLDLSSFLRTPDEPPRSIEERFDTKLSAETKDLLPLRAANDAPALLPSRELELLATINRGLPSGLAAHYGELIQKRRKGVLAADEHADLLRLSDQVEDLEAKRVKALAELASLRGISLSRLMAELGIQPPDA